MGSLLIASVNDFFGNYLRTTRISDYEIVVLGRDIVTREQVSDDGKISYRSNFHHVHFCSGISPNSNVESYAYGLNMTEFVESYNNQLNMPDVMMNLCCIIDLIVNRGRHVILLCSEREFKMGFVDVLREFIFNRFGLYMITVGEYMYDPGLLTQYGDDADIRRKLEFTIKEFKFVDEYINRFINKFSDDTEEIFRDILMKKSIDELYQYGVKNSIHVNKYKPKEYIVDRIMRKLLNK